MKNARYRWHRQKFPVGTLDRNASYLLSCNTVAGISLIWVNGQFLDRVPLTDSYVTDITPYLREDTSNTIVLRNEIRDDLFGINRLRILKAPADTVIEGKSTDYHAMPLYHLPSDDMDELIIYEAFIRNMSDPGTFTGFRNTVMRLNQLGVNMVWLMPIHPVGKADRQGSLGSPYAVRDHFSTNARYGTLSDLRSLRSMLHRNKIRLILDAVTAQTASDHPWVDDYPDYYRKDGAGRLLAAPAAVDGNILELNYENANLRERMLSYLDFWIEQGVDGFRLHRSGDVPMDFWQNTRDHFSERGEDPFLLGGGNAPEHLISGINAVDDPALYNSFVALAKGDADASIIGKTLFEEAGRYPEGSKVLHYAEHHGTPRAIKALGVKDHHLALVTVFSAPGIPLIYCGEELSDPPKMSLYEKTDMNWYRIHWPTYNLISKLAKFRKNSQVLTRGDLKPIADTRSVGGFSRRYRNETWYVLLNYSDREQIYQCDVSSTVFSDGSSGVLSEGRVRLEPKGYCIVK
ncbi:MAG: alpha-amylase family glycosyl hydrolase [Candidatus Marinimicrobia bacterium]|nr:alpha-amylase family glycosyl hydrolase [Candidatus Neomarinimicrobiota bacterium]